MVSASEVAKQREFEDLSVGLTKARLNKWQTRFQKQNQVNDQALAELEKVLPHVCLEIKQWLDAQKSKRRKPEAFEVLSCLAPEISAFIGLSTSYGLVHKEPEIRKVCYDIGWNVEQELWGLNLKKHDPSLFNRVFKIVKVRHNANKLKVKSARIIAKKAGYQADLWGPSRRIAIGRDILNCVLRGCSVFGLVMEGDKVNLCITPEARDNLDKQAEREVWQNLLYLPMLIPPNPWTSTVNGPYVTRKMQRQVPLVRTYNKEHTEAVQRAIEAGTGEPFLRALNAIQNVPLTINEPVLHLVEWAYKNDIKAGKLPKKTRLPKPERVVESNLDERSLKGLRLKHSKIEQINRSIDANAVMMERDLETARMLQGKAFWLPHNVDFRGRVYPVPSFNHQRSDHIKALFGFEQAKPLGTSGAYWLAVHLANVGDFDKISKKSMHERVKWVYDNERFILETSEDPTKNRGWQEADKPFQFYAACLDWAGYLHSGEQSTYVTQLPVSVDGSNSGLQHYSALLRSRPDADKVSLTKRDYPADLYAIVAEQVSRAVEQDRGNPLAERWAAFGVTRKIVKRNVMTFPYSSETFGFKEQLMEDLMLPLEYEVLTNVRDHHPFGDNWGDWQKASFYLAKHVWRAVNEIVSDASRGMSWFQGVARSLAGKNLAVTWTTPVGFPVVHRYTEYESNQVKLWFDYRGARIQSSVRVNERSTDVIRKVKQANAIAPNVIHSLDAAHLMLTVLRAEAEGITDFMFIHDCFGCHAGNMGRFSQIVREAFIDMYERHDPLMELYDVSRVFADTPAPPARGDFDVREVLKAEYAFA